MLTSQFAELFEGRKDAYGTDSGGCLRVKPNYYNDCGLADPFYQQHLEGSVPIGVYPAVNFGGECLAKFGCVDFDRKSENHKSFDYETEEECHTAAVNLVKVLKHLGVTSWIERTRSSGRHVWVFCQTWTPASIVRRSLLVATSVAGVSAREVNPKQETLAEGQLGNYVRVPFPGALGRALSHQVIIGGPLVEGRYASWSLSDFVKTALAERTSPQTLEAIAAKWREPETQRSVVDWDVGRAILDVLLLSRLSETGRSVFTRGPNDGDRSRGMVYLAKQAKLSGLTPSEALTLLHGAHWNKYRGRADEVKQLRDIVERAWT